MNNSSDGQASLVLNTSTPVLEAPGDFRGQATLKAGADASLNYNAYMAGISSVALEVQNEQGKVMPHLPPPVPDPEAIHAGARKLEAGAVATLDLRDLSVSPGLLPAGGYKVRMKLEARTGAGSKVDLHSNWVAVEVR